MNLYDEELAEQEVVVAELREDPYRTALRNNVADALAAAVGHLLDKVQQKDAAEPSAENIQKDGPVKAVLKEATATAVGAVEGTLKSKSLDGALKLAQIEETYARIRATNAQAELAHAQAVQVREDMAWQRLERAIELVKALGGEVSITRLPDGRPGITIGHGLAAPKELSAS
jgi:cation diffusion facilitator CzcD-associated flavoprotein CzcO